MTSRASTPSAGSSAGREIRDLHERMGRVWHQPLPVASFTNKRVTLSFRAPVGQVRRLLPEAVEADEIGSTGLGMVSMCACDFWVTRIGPFPMPRVHTNEMLCRVSARVGKQGRVHRAYYTLRSDASSRLLGTLGGWFSHFRKAVSEFTKLDDGKVYELVCRAKDPLCNGRITVDLGSLSKEVPETSVFASNEAATEFVLGLDGSCGYDYGSGRLSLQRIAYPAWDTRFVHVFEHDLALLDHLFSTFRIDAELDHALYLENVAQEWGRSSLYRPERVRGGMVAGRA